MYTIGSPHASRVMRWPIRACSIASTNVMRDTPAAQGCDLPAPRILTFNAVGQIQNSRGNPDSVSVNPIVPLAVNPVP